MIENDLQLAKKRLEGHSICLVIGDKIITHDGRGISPMLELLEKNTALQGASVADIIVGKAAAMLFCKAGIVSVYGKVMSRAGYEYLNAHGIKTEYDTLTDRIINRKGDDICPMEKTVEHIDDVDAGFFALLTAFNNLKK